MQNDVVENAWNSGVKANKDNTISKLQSPNEFSDQLSPSSLEPVGIQNRETEKKEESNPTNYLLSKKKTVEKIKPSH